MKKYEFEITHSVYEKFFPKERVKTKIQILEILMEATRYILYSPKNTNLNSIGKLVLLVDKMSRLFFFTNEKYYSIVFPFFVNGNDNELTFSFQNNIDVDAQLISNVITIIKCDSFYDRCSLDFVDPIYNIENDFNENFWSFLRELLVIEDGYIRYDNDLKGYEEAKNKGKEQTHPINHLDVFYSNNVTFKIGLEQKITEQEFIDTLDIQTNCRYIR